jgi:hypothetical protein
MNEAPVYISFKIYMLCNELNFLSLFSGTQAEKVENPKLCENSKRAEPPCQILCHEIEPNRSKDGAMHEGDNDEFIKYLNLLFSRHVYETFLRYVLRYVLRYNFEKK